MVYEKFTYHLTWMAKKYSTLVDKTNVQNTTLHVKLPVFEVNFSEHNFGGFL